MKINKNILILIDAEMIESVKLGYYLVLIDTDKQDPAGSLDRSGRTKSLVLPFYCQSGIYLAIRSRPELATKSICAKQSQKSILSNYLGVRELV